MTFRTCVSVVALIAGGALPSLALAQQIGTVAAVNRDMTGTPPGAGARDLQLGLDVVRNERVETSQIGSGQLMFVDQTTLTVSPSSNIVLDDYVYDASADAGDVALSMTQGALRFIGGRITKTGPGIVRTPTATVGIRGGMAVIEVDSDGVAEVIHIAGEYTFVRQCGDANGDGLDDGCGPGEALSEVVLSRPNASARADRKGVKFTGLASAERLAGIYGRLEGQGQGGVSAPPTDSAVQTGSGQVATVNSGVPGGETNQPVSTSGEQAAPPAGPAEQVSGPVTLVQNTNPAVGGSPDDAGAPVVTPGAQVGAIFSEGEGYRPFTSVSGSITGQAGDETVTLPVPASADALLQEHPEGEEFTPRAVALYPGAGMFSFDPESASSTRIGGLGGEFGTAGTGFADLGNGFVYAPFITASGFQPGIALFGTPTPGQGQFFAGDTDTSGAITVDTYANEHGFDLGRSFLFIGGGGRSPIPQELRIVAPSGAPRFQEQADGHHAAPVGRAVSAGLEIAGDGFSRDERLAIFVAPLTSSTATPATEMQISEQGFVTRNTGGNYSFGQPFYGTFEDGQGNTLFGPDGNYLVLSSVHRDRDGTLVTNDFGTDEVLLDQFADGGTTTFDPPFRASLFTRDPTRSGVIEQPLPLASQPGGHGTDGNILDGGFAAGIAVCSSTNCGERGEAGFTGLYPLVSAAGPFGNNIRFEEGTAGLSGHLALTDRELSNTQGAGAEGDPDLFFFNVSNNGITATGDRSYGAYLDDERFAAAGTGLQIIAGHTQPGTFALASSGLAGAGQPGSLFPSGVDTTPEFLRWGYWSATWQSIDGDTGQTRTDLVPLGTFVVGNTPDPQVLTSFTGSARYEGLAVATAADLSSGTTRTIGGSFALDYDFSERQGTFGLSLPEFSTPSLSVGVSSDSGNIIYEGFTTGPVASEVRGAFFAGGGNPVAATAGDFDIRDHHANTAAVGVFGGDATASGSPAVTAQ